MYKDIEDHLHAIATRKKLRSALDIIPADIARNSVHDVLAYFASTTAHQHANQVVSLVDVDEHGVEWILECMAFAVRYSYAQQQQQQQQQLQQQQQHQQHEPLTTEQAELELCRMKNCVAIYHEWLTLIWDTGQVEKAEEERTTALGRIPQPMLSKRIHYGERIIWHMYHVFTHRPGAGELFIGWQCFYCKRLLRLLDKLTCRYPSAALDTTDVSQLHCQMLLLIMAVTDTVLGNPENSHMSTLNAPCLYTLFKVWVQSARLYSVSDECWSTLYSLVPRWTPMLVMWEEWGSVCEYLTDVIADLWSLNSPAGTGKFSLHNSSFIKHHCNNSTGEEPTRNHEFNIDTPDDARILYDTWFRMLFLVPLPSLVISELVRNQTDSSNVCEKVSESILGTVDRLTSSLVKVRWPCTINSLLHLFGDWMFRLAVCPFDDTSSSNHIEIIGKTRASAVGFLLRLVSNVTCVEPFSEEYVLRLAYVIESNIRTRRKENTLVLHRILVDGQNLYRLSLAGINVTIPQLICLINDLVTRKDSVSAVVTPLAHCLDDDAAERNTAMIQILLSIGCRPFSVLMGSRAQESKVRLCNLLIHILRQQTIPVHLISLLAIIRMVQMYRLADDIKEDKPITLSGFNNSLIKVICKHMLGHFVDNHQVTVVLLQLLLQMASDRLCPQLSTVTHVIWTLCDFIKKQLNKEPFRHVKGMHTAVVLAFDCVGSWLVLSSTLASDICQKIADVIEVGLSGSLSPDSLTMVAKGLRPYRPASRRVEYAAERLMHVLIDGKEPVNQAANNRCRHSSSFIMNGAPESSSLIDDHEVVLMTTGQNLLRVREDGESSIEISFQTVHDNCRCQCWPRETTKKDQCPEPTICVIPITNVKAERHVSSLTIDPLKDPYFTLPTPNSIETQFSSQLSSVRRCIGTLQPSKPICGKLNVAKRRKRSNTKKADAYKTPVALFFSQCNFISADSLTDSSFKRLLVIPSISDSKSQDIIPGRPVPANVSGKSYIFYIRRSHTRSIDFRSQEFVADCRLDQRFVEFLRELGRRNVIDSTTIYNDDNYCKKETHNDPFANGDCEARITVRELDGVSFDIKYMSDKCEISFVASSELALTCESKAYSLIQPIGGMGKQFEDILVDRGAGDSSSGPGIDDRLMAVVWLENRIDVSAFRRTAVLYSLISGQTKQNPPLICISPTSCGLFEVNLLNMDKSWTAFPLADQLVVSAPLLTSLVRESVLLATWKRSVELSANNSKHVKSGILDRRHWLFQQWTSAVDRVDCLRTLPLVGGSG